MGDESAEIMATSVKIGIRNSIGINAQIFETPLGVAQMHNRDDTLSQSFLYGNVHK